MKTLIVEDDFTSRLLLQEFLKAYGPCHIAGNGGKAIEAVSLALDAQEPYDLICLDIMMPDGQTRIPTVQRNAGGRQFRTASELNAFITRTNAGGGINGVLLPLVSDSARFTDAFNSLDIRLSRPFTVGRHVGIEPMVEVFNLFNVANILGVSNVNYSGFSNVLVRDSEQPGTPGFSTRAARPSCSVG